MQPTFTENAVKVQKREDNTKYILNFYPTILHLNWLSNSCDRYLTLYPAPNPAFYPAPKLTITLAIKYKVEVTIKYGFVTNVWYLCYQRLVLLLPASGTFSTNAWYLAYQNFTEIWYCTHQFSSFDDFPDFSTCFSSKMMLNIAEKADFFLV